MSVYVTPTKKLCIESKDATHHGEQYADILKGLVNLLQRQEPDSVFDDETFAVLRLLENMLPNSEQAARMFKN